MSPTRTDIIVVLVGLFAGYFLVSWLLRQFNGGKQEKPKPGAGSGQGYWRERDEPEQPVPPNPDSTRKPWYEVLQVPAYASFDEVKLAYRRRIAEYHPDKTSGLGDELRKLAEEKTKVINAAYDEALRAFG